MAKPTNRQKHYAIDIAQNLKIPLPVKETLEEYGKYIATYAEKNREVTDEMKERARKRKATEETKEKYPIPEVEPRLRLNQNRMLMASEPLNSPEAIIHFMQKYMRGFDREHVFVVNLDAEAHALNVSCVAVGTVTDVATSCRDIFKSVILSNATGIFLFHNHPCGVSVTPSKEDNNVTREVAECCNLFGIRLLDHIIVNGTEDFYSYRKQSRIFIP